MRFYWLAWLNSLTHKKALHTFGDPDVILTVHHLRRDFHDSNCCRSDRPKSTHHSGHIASNRLAPPAHGPPPTCSVSTLLGLVRHKDRNCTMSFSDRTPRATLWSNLTVVTHEDAAPCAQPALYRAHRKGYAGPRFPRRWFRDRPHFSGQYNGHSIISYTTIDPDHPDYTFLSAHPLSRQLFLLTFILLRGELCGSLPWKPPTGPFVQNFPDSVNARQVQVASKLIFVPFITISRPHLDCSSFSNECAMFRL
jgi:hypothetical protein